MTPLVIILILIGAGIILVSCFLADNSTGKGEIYSSLVGQRELTITEIENIKKKVETIISEITEESVAKTEDSLSQLSNEKIIAVNDFSNQVIEKISQNHEEVVFLYNMLNEKESELKDTIKSIDKAKKQVTKADKKELPNHKLKGNAAAIHKSPVHNPVAEAGNINENNKADIMNNHNQKILEMDSQGFSVIDISKTLELGQGEVKLVIDLYKDR